MEPVRVVLVEDDAPTRRRIAAAFKGNDGFEATEAATLAEARAALADAAPDVLVTDLDLPDGNAVELIREVRAQMPAVEILVISVLADERNVVAAVTAGASGYVLKDALPEDIAATVRDVLQGHSPVSAAIARFILRRIAPEDEAPPPEAPQLTQREQDILWGIAKGFTYNEIAEQLGISHNTVPNYVKSIYRKLEVTSRSEAVFEAIQHRLIDLKPD